MGTRYKIRIPWACPDIGEEEREILNEVVDSTWIGGNGPLVREFERKLCQYTGAKYAIATCNGTTALMTVYFFLKEFLGELKLCAPTFTFIATVNAAVPFADKITLVDCQKDTWNIDPYEVSKVKEKNVIVATDVGGLSADYDLLMREGLVVVDDAAEGLGGMYKGKRLGSIADITTFSFHSAKIVTTGEGGAILTDNKIFYEEMKAIVNQGYYKKKQPWEYKHSRIGFNFRMPETSAAIGVVQMKKLSKFLRHRQEIASLYKDELGDTVEYQCVPREYHPCVHPYFLFGILVPRKKQLKIVKEALKEGIQLKITWKPVHLQKSWCFQHTQHHNAEYVYKRIVSLPIHNKLTEEEAKEVVDVVKRCLK